MFITNTIKIAGCLLMLFERQPARSPTRVVGLGAAAYSPAKYGILTEYLPHEQAGDRQRLDRGPHGRLDHPRHGAGRRADQRRGVRHAARVRLAAASTPASTPRPRPRSRSSSSSTSIAAIFNLYIPRHRRRAQAAAGATRSTLLRDFAHCCTLPVARQARPDLARRDHAVLGRRRDAAVHRPRLGARRARLQPVARPRCCRAWCAIGIALGAVLASVRVSPATARSSVHPARHRHGPDRDRA